jgi:phosphate:Na+ symporter
MGSTVILDLMGGIALLLWGLHMVHSGVVRAFGADLRRLLGIALKSRLRAFLAGQAELVEFHQQVVDSLSLSVGIFMSGDINIARQLIAAKAQLREREFAAAERYFVRLREGTPDTIESYSLDLDILRSEARPLASVFGCLPGPRTRRRPAAQPPEGHCAAQAEAAGKPAPDQTADAVTDLCGKKTYSSPW